MWHGLAYFAMLYLKLANRVHLNISPSLPSYKYIVVMRSPRKEIVSPSGSWLFYMFFLTAELFLTEVVQTLCSSERLRRCNVRSSWVVQESILCYCRLSVRIHRLIGKELLSVVGNNLFTVHLSKGLHISAHKGLVFDTLVHQCQRRLVMRNQFYL